MRKMFVFMATQLFFSVYCLYLANCFDGLFYLIPIGIISIVLCLSVLIRKKLAIVLNISFFVILIAMYTILFFDLLIVRGFIHNLSDGFLLMGIAFHAPIICYSFFAVIFLLFNIKTNGGDGS